jgi:hypothetical protein
MRARTVSHAVAHSLVVPVEHASSASLIATSTLLACNNQCSALGIGIGNVRQLATRGNLEKSARHHAECYRRLRTGSAWSTKPASTSLAGRSALRWCAAGRTALADGQASLREKERAIVMDFNKVVRCLRQGRLYASRRPGMRRQVQHACRALAHRRELEK